MFIRLKTVLLAWKKSQISKFVEYLSRMLSERQFFKEFLTCKKNALFSRPKICSAPPPPQSKKAHLLWGGGGRVYGFTAWWSYWQNPCFLSPGKICWQSSLAFLDFMVGEHTLKCSDRTKPKRSLIAQNYTKKVSNSPELH